VVEKYQETPGSVGSKKNFYPHIFVELKSGKGDSLEKAVDLSTSSMGETVNNSADNFAIYMMIVKGKYVAFFQYHNDRTNLYEDGVPNTKGAISFNHVKPLTLMEGLSTKEMGV
jgi:hypothetical protein